MKALEKIKPKRVFQLDESDAVLKKKKRFAIPCGAKVIRWQMKKKYEKTKEPKRGKRRREKHMNEPHQTNACETNA